MKEWIFDNTEQIKQLRYKIITETDASVDELTSHSKGISLLKSIKFNQVGYDSVLEKRTNFIEQVNQTFTYLVSLQAVEYLMLNFPNTPFRANFGVKSGYDVESLDGTIVCECSATTIPSSNDKLKQDTKRLFENNTAIHKYVIYYAELDKLKYRENLQSKYPTVKIIALTKIV